jgi:predicted DNA-binding WGR domain protein
MNSLTKGIEYAIKNAIDEYVKCISTKCEDIDIDDLGELWDEVSKSIKISVTMKSAIKARSVDTTDTVGCSYMFIKGAKQDQTCGAKTKAGNVYCSRHKKYEGTEQKERKSPPDPRRSTVKPKSKSRSPVKEKQRVLRKNKTLDKLWHPETGLVFKSAKERTVIGKCVDEKIVNLKEEDIDECRKWGFSFIPLEDPDADLEEDNSSDEEEVDTAPKERSIYMEAPSSSASGKKFWECKVSGENYSTNHGKVGKKGITKEKIFESFAIASKEMDKIVKTKSKKGYKVVTTATVVKETQVKKSRVDDCFKDPSDIEDVLDELQGDSSDNSDLEEEHGIGKKFIPNALGLRGKATALPLDDDDENEDMLIEDFDE